MDTYIRYGTIGFRLPSDYVHGMILASNETSKTNPQNTEFSLQPPPLDSLEWQILSIIFGVLLVFQSCHISYRLFIGRMVHWRIVTCSFLVLGTVTRGIFYLLEPLYSRNVIPSYIVALLYGLFFPSLVSAVCLSLLHVLDTVISVREMQNNISAAERIKEFLPRTWIIFAFFSALLYGEGICVTVLSETRG
eukprot:1325539-Amorphochlora_amoeboformis.AAC.2